MVEWSGFGAVINLELRPDNRLQAFVGVRAAMDVVDDNFPDAGDVTDVITGFHRAVGVNSGVVALVREALRTGAWISYDMQTLDEPADPALHMITAVALDFVSPPRVTVTFEPAETLVNPI